MLNKNERLTVAVSTILKQLLELICSFLFHFFCIFCRVEGNNLLIKFHLMSRRQKETRSAVVKTSFPAHFALANQLSTGINFYNDICSFHFMFLLRSLI